MKKIVYGLLACIIIVGAVLIGTIGLNVDIIYSKNVEMDIYVGKKVELKDIESIAKEVFPNERMIIQRIELFDDMVSIVIPEKTDEELKPKVEELNTKINEKYETENDASEDINIIHNPKMRLYSILKPYILPIAIATVIILVYIAIRYRKLGVIKVTFSYVLYTLTAEAVFLALIAITRIPVNRFIIPVGLIIYITTMTVLNFINERKLTGVTQTEKTKNK